MSEVREIRATPEQLSVCIGLPTGQYLPWQTAVSLAATTRACALRGIPIDAAVIAGAAIVTEARNQVIKAFLETTASRLFWIDSDIEWQPDDFLRLLVLSEEMPVLCAAYARKRLDQRLTIKHPDLKTFERNAFGCVKIEATGLGFTVLRREVIQKLVDSVPTVYDEVQDAEIPDVFRVDSVLIGKRRTRRGEDAAFFRDVRALGYDVWLDPSVKLGHVGTHVFRADPKEALGL